MSLRVAIVGAGIGGLTAAIALRARGVDATVYEQAHELKALGAGVAIATNGSRVLTELGLGDAIDAVAGRVSAYAYRTSTGDALPADPAELSLGDPERTWFLHRGEFQRVLSQALPPAGLQMGRRCTRVVQTPDAARIEFADGSAVEADVVVGADGIHSRLQGAVTDPADPVSEGVMAYRGLLPAERVRGVVDMDVSAMWLGPGQSFLLYPVSSGRLMNLVAFVPTTLDVEESWTAPGDVAELARAYRGWDDRVLRVIDAMDETFRWGIYDREPLDRWSAGHVTLLGDSAHAVTPHLGQGANQAIEDAITLAATLADAGPRDVPDRLALYESLRRDRTRLVRSRAREAGALYRSTDVTPAQQADRLKAIYDSIQINTHDAEAVAAEALSYATASR